METNADRRQYNTAMMRRVFALKSNLEIMKIWTHANVTVSLVSVDTDPYRFARAKQAVDLCEYTLKMRGLCPTLDGDTWTDGPISAPSEMDEQGQLF